MKTSSVSSVKITGLATGMDIDAMVEAMVKSEQNKVDAVKQKQQITKWQQEQYREIITDIKDFSSKYFDVLSSDNLISSKSLSTATVKSSNTSVVSAIAGSSAIESNYTFEVEKLATAPSMSSDRTLSKTDKLGDLGLSGERSFKVGLGNGVSSSVIKIDENDTIESIISKLNNASDSKFTATYSEMTGKFSIKSNTTGEASELSIVDVELQDDGTFKETGTTSSLDFLGIKGDIVKGENSIIKVKDESGALIKELKQEKNSFTIDGVTYDVKGVGIAKLETQVDTTDAVETIKKFVEDYNKLVSDIYTKTKEKKNNDFPPLTDAQKKEMTKEEIENWEEKAKVGHLRNDNELTRFLNEMTMNFRGALNNFGIEVSSDYSKPNELTINIDKLTDSIKSNPAQVVNSFKSTIEKTKSTMTKYVGNSKAVLVQKSGLSNTASDVNNVFSQQIKKQEETIKNLIRKLNAKQDALYLKFGKLESTMSQLNNQMAYLMQ